MLLNLYFFFLLLLILNIPFYHVLIYSNCTNKISSCSKVIPPIRFLPHFWITFEQLNCQLTFQGTHHFRHRHFRWYRYNKMNMINLNIHLVYLTSFPFTQLPYIIFYKGFDFTYQYTKTILWNPNNMIITFIDYMRKFFIFTHATNIGIANRTLPPSKTVDF